MGRAHFLGIGLIPNNIGTECLIYTHIQFLVICSQLLVKIKNDLVVLTKYGFIFKVFKNLSRAYIIFNNIGIDSKYMVDSIFV